MGRWVMRWQDPDAPMAMSASGFEGLSLSGYRLALLASHCNDPIFEPFEAPTSGREAFDFHDHDEEEISWNDLNARGRKQQLPSSAFTSAMSFACGCRRALFVSV